MGNVHLLLKSVNLAPLSALPLGFDRKARETQLEKVSCEYLLHSVLAISYCDPVVVKAEENVLEEESRLLLYNNVMGFVYVSEVDEAKGVMTVLSPNSGKLIKRYLLLGSLKWVENE